jgi:hypothetical protein
MHTARQAIDKGDSERAIKYLTAAIEELREYAEAHA